MPTDRPCIVDPSVDEYTYDDCTCDECRLMQRHAAWANQPMPSFNDGLIRGNGGGWFSID